MRFLQQMTQSDLAAFDAAPAVSKLTRRDFMKATGAAGGGLMLVLHWQPSASRATTRRPSS
jgi:hypothetical protein